jgi:hypothetical protein
VGRVVGKHKRHDKAPSKNDEPRAHDRLGAYSREQLLRMNRHFTVAVERAFASGRESPRAATATFLPRCVNAGAADNPANSLPAA